MLYYGTPFSFRQQNYTFIDNLISAGANYNITKGVMPVICDRIRTLRETCGLSQSALAKKIGVTRSAVNAWEMGLSIPTAQYLVALAQLFQISTDYLLGFSAPNPSTWTVLRKRKNSFCTTCTTILRKKIRPNRKQNQPPVPQREETEGWFCLLLCHFPSFSPPGYPS